MKKIYQNKINKKMILNLNKIRIINHFLRKNDLIEN